MGGSTCGIARGVASCSLEAGELPTEIEKGRLGRTRSRIQIHNLEPILDEIYSGYEA